MTTSTTEAELLSLAEAAKEALYASRLLTELGVQLDQDYIQLWCDNQQTIRLVTEETAKLQTKLRHVDIHNHWLRQAVQSDQVTVDYVKSSDMYADGLTKALGPDQFEAFKRQVGIVDVQEHVQARELRELHEGHLEELEDAFDDLNCV